MIENRCVVEKSHARRWLLFGSIGKQQKLLSPAVGKVVLRNANTVNWLQAAVEYHWSSTLWSLLHKNLLYEKNVIAGWIMFTENCAFTTFSAVLYSSRDSILYKKHKITYLCGSQGQRSQADTGTRNGWCGQCRFLCCSCEWNRRTTLDVSKNIVTSVSFIFCSRNLLAQLTNFNISYKQLQNKLRREQRSPLPHRMSITSQRRN